jgi:hypothetical protein
MPAYTGEQVPEELLPPLISPEWVEERTVRWGITSPNLSIQSSRRTPRHLR